MATPSLQPTSVRTWKRLAVISLSAGAGFALMLSVIVGGIVWHSSRPKPPKPWDTNVIIAKEPPSFSVSSDGEKIDFTYTLENTTSSDYRIDSDSAIKVLLRTKEGILSPPLSTKSASVRLPVFIPAKQKVFFSLSIRPAGIPKRNADEPDNEFHERLRSYLEQYLAGTGGFVIFEDSNRYQINLPKWLPERPK